MTDATAVPVNVFENDRELMVVAPMPGVSPEDISIDVTDDGGLTLRAAQHGEGQERIDYLTREWSYGPYERTIELPCAVDADARQRHIRQRRPLDHVPEGRRHGGRAGARPAHRPRPRAWPRGTRHAGRRRRDRPARARVILYFLRHGKAGEPRADERRRRVSSRRRGRDALRAAAPLWRRLNLRPDVVLSSPLPRALQTAELLCEAVGGTPIVDDRLRPGASWADLAPGPWRGTPMPDG